MDVMPFPDWPTNWPAKQSAFWHSIEPTDKPAVLSTHESTDKSAFWHSFEPTNESAISATFESTDW
jgi:hypothetical protein